MNDIRNYGAETEKALLILGPSQTPRLMIQAYAEVKLAALEAQQESSKLYPDAVFSVLQETCRDIISGDHDLDFPLPLKQGGAGTSLHMNICEVLASHANHKNKNSFQLSALDHLARFQSTNDTFSTAVIIMAYRLAQKTEDSIIKLQEALVAKEKEYQQWLMCGRTEMQDALPMTLGQVFSSWAGPVERDRWRLNKVRERLRLIPLGGTAVGTGYSAPPSYRFAAEKALRRITGLPLCCSQNLPDQIAHWDNLSEWAASMGLCADNLYKWTGDLLIYSSSFLNEIPQEEKQFGSTIMPDKSNPVLIEMIRGLSLSVSASASLIARYASEGQLQLNAYLPFMADEILRISENLIKALDLACDELLPALKPKRAVLEKNVLNSAVLFNSLRHKWGYDKLKALLKERPEEGFNSKDDFIRWLSKYTDYSISELEEQLELHKLISGGIV